MQVHDFLVTATGLEPGQIDKLIASAITIAVLWILRFLVLRLAYGRSEDLRFRYQWRKVTNYIAVPIALIILIRIWFGGGASMLTYFGLLSAGVAIALRDPLVNLAGWGFILWRRPFVVGDRIQVGDLRGDVIDLRIFQFTLMEIGNWVAADQSTGRIVHVPNLVVFQQSVANYTQGFPYIWHEIPVVLTFESNWAKAHEILTRVVNHHSLEMGKEAEKELKVAAERYLIFFRNVTPIVYVKVVDFGVALTLRFLCDVRKRRGVEDAIWRSILEEFAPHADIDFAYPTQRFFDHSREGKPIVAGLEYATVPTQGDVDSEKR